MLISRIKCFTESARPIKVDREAGVIYGVKVLGLISENGRRYLEKAVKEAAPLYEGIMVNVDHPENAGDSRSAQDRIGKLVNVHYVEGKGLYGDLEFLKSHPMAERICEAAERMPDAFGMSHNAQGDGEDEDGVFVVHKIVEVRHVDLVADPATTKSLNESKATNNKTKKRRSKMKEASGEKKFNTYAAWLRAVKAAGATKIDGNKDIATALNAQGKGVGEWDGAEGVIYAVKEAEDDSMKEASQSTYDAISDFLRSIKSADSVAAKISSDKLGPKAKKLWTDVKNKLSAIKSSVSSNTDLEEAEDDEDDKDTMEADNAEFGSKAAEIIDGDGDTPEKVAALVELVKSMYGEMKEAEEPEMEYNDGDMEEEGSASDEVDAQEQDGVHVDINSHDGKDKAGMEAEDDEDVEEEEDEETEEEDEKKPMEAKESRRYISRLCKASRVRLSEQLVNDLKGLPKGAIQRQIKRIALAQKAKKPKSSIMAVTESKIPQGEDLFRWLRS